MVEREERPLGIGYNLHKGITKHRLVESQACNDTTQRITRTISPTYQRLNHRNTLVAHYALTSDIVGLIVDDTAVCHRVARDKRKSIRQHIIATPLPHPVRHRCGCRTETQEGLGTVARSSHASILHSVT